MNGFLYLLFGAFFILNLANCSSSSGGGGSSSGKNILGGPSDPTKPNPTNPTNPTPGGFGSCMHSNNGICVDYVGSYYKDISSQMQMACTNSQGQYSTSGCPAENRVGSCTMQSGANDEYVIRGYPPMTNTNLSYACQQDGGVFSN